MEDIMYYPVVDVNTEGFEKQAFMPTPDRDSVREHHRFWLEEIVPHYFRLCSAESQARRTVSEFRIHCPYCGNILSPISSIVEDKRFFLYACDKCTKKRGEHK